MKKVIFAAMVAASVGAMAEGEKATGSGPNPFVDCGIGAALFADTHWAAVSSNVIWDMGTTALTSATASPETCNGKQTQTAQFIYDTYDQLVEDAARGQGEHLVSLMNILETAEEDRSALTDQVRQGLANHVAISNYDQLSRVEKAKAFYDIVDQAVSSS